VGKIGGNAVATTSARCDLIGTTIEWYDFFLYGSASRFGIGATLLPLTRPSHREAGLFRHLYGVGFAARPVGGIIVGHYAEGIGRKTMLLILLMCWGSPRYS